MTKKCNIFSNKMKQTKTISGMSLHLHHNILFEFCHSFDERVTAIKTTKPKNEIKTRLKLFRMLTKEEIKMLPLEFVEAWQKWDEAWQKWDEARQKLDEAWQKWDEARQKLHEARQKWHEIFNIHRLEIEEIHKKICNCKEWNGKEIIF